MLRFVLSRIGVAAISVFGIVVLIFFVTQLLPGDPARMAAGQYANEELLAQIRTQYGLDQPIQVQFAAYLGGLLHFDLGTSIRTDQPVLSELLARLPASLELSITALLVAVIVGVGLGVLSAVQRFRAVDRVVSIIVILASATAIFWVALLAIFLLVNQWGVFDSPIGRLPRGYPVPSTVTGSYVLDALLSGDLTTAAAAFRTLIFPAALLGLIGMPPIAKVVRSSMIRALEADYSRTSRSFGYSDASILIHDGLRNSLLPVLTTVGLVAGFLIGSTVIIEQLFSWPGMGQYAYYALTQNDLFALRGFVIFIGVAYVIINTVLEILYRLVDPRVRPAEGR